MTIAEKLQTIAENQPKIYEAGYAKGQAEGGDGDNYYDTFWDAFQDYGNRTIYEHAFHSPYNSTMWTDENYNPKYPFVCSGSNCVDCMFQYAAITDTKVPIYVDGKGGSYMFVSCTKLKTIRLLYVTESTVFTSWFSGCSALENLTFARDSVIAGSLSFSNSPKLSTDSVQSVIDHLKDLTGKTAQTLTLHQTVKGALTDDQRAAIAAKNWELA